MKLSDIISPTEKSSFNKNENLVALCLFILLWVYLFLRAVHLPLLHDEVATFYYYIQTGIVFPPEAHYDANNHVLNSLLSHWSYQIFGSSPLAIRLPNVLAFALFFFGIKGIASRVENGIFRWGFLLSATMSFFLFEYFSETRGYGISMAFLAAAIFQYIKLTENGQTKHLLLAGFFLLLSTSANLTTLISSVILFGLMFIHSLLIDFKTNKIRLWSKIIGLIIIGLPFLILVKWSFKLKELGLLYYGSLDGFYKVTVQSLFEVFVGSYHPWMSLLVTIIFSSIIVYLILHIFQTKSLQKFISGKNILALLLIGSVLMINLLAWIMKVNFPEDRAGMYLFIYLTGAMAFTFSHWVKKYKIIYLVSAGYLFFPISFLIKADLRQSTFAVTERNSEPIYDKATTFESNFKFPLVVGGYITQELHWYYMNYQDGGEQGRLHWSNHPGLDADVQLVSSTRIDENHLLKTYYDSILYDPAADLILFKRKQFLNKKLIKVTDIPSVENSSDEYFSFMDLPADTLQNKTLFIGVELILDATTEPFRSRLVATADSETENLAYEFVQLDWLRKSWNGKENNLLQGTLIHNVPKNATSISFYLWNQFKTPFSISNGKCYLYEVERDY